MIYVIIIKHVKFCYSLIESQLLPCRTACGCKFHALAVYLHPIFTARFQSEVHLESCRISTVELFAEIVDVFRALTIFAEELHHGCLTRFQLQLCPIIHHSLQKVWGEASITGVTQENLGLTLPPNSLDLHQAQKGEGGVKFYFFGNFYPL